LIRLLDFTFALVGLLIGSPILLLIFAVCFFETGSPLFIQERLGRRQRIFKLAKFRTMSKGTISVASHLVDSNSITKTGNLLRRTKLDELPQLWNVLKGEMSLVGPRPGLPSQDALTKARALQDVYSVKPGITGLAQIKGIDMSTPELLARTDVQMIAEMSVTNYFRFIFLTVIGNGRGDRIKQK
jgi:O-antigen biosynthesis protein WbqP